MWSELLLVTLRLAAVGDASAAAADPCAPAGRVTASHGVELSPSCRAGHWAEGQQLQLAPGGFVELEVGGELALCANATEAKTSAWLTLAFPPTAEPALLCQPLAGGGRSCTPQATEGMYCYTRPTGNAQRAGVFVLDVVGTDVAADEARVVTRLATAELARMPELDVSSGDEVRELLKEEAARQHDDGCTDDSACLARVAGALGARWLVTGTLARVGRATRVELTLIDTASAEVAARSAADAESTLSLARRLPDVTHNLAVPIRGGEQRTIEPARFSRRMADPRAAWAAALTGAGVGAGLLLCAAVPAVGCTALAIPLGLLPMTYALSPLWLVVFSPSLWAAPLTACGIGGASSLAADWCFDAQLGWLRALTTAAVTAGCTVSTILVGGFVAELVLSYPGGVSTRPPAEQNVAGAAAIAAILGTAVLGSAALAGVAYDFGIGLYGDAPTEVTADASRAPEAPRRVAAPGELDVIAY